MSTQRQKSIKWWNSLGNTKRNDLALDYWGNTLITDDEIEFIFLREIPQEKLYDEKEIRSLCLSVMNLGMDLRQNQLSGFNCKSGNEVLEEFLSNFFALKTKIKEL